MGLKERRKREIRERHTQIMDAARMVLFKHGMPMASIKRIAQTAELGVGTLYSYFGSKEDIFIALQEEGLEMLAQEIRENRPGCRRSPDAASQDCPCLPDFQRRGQRLF